MVVTCRSFANGGRHFSYGTLLWPTVLFLCYFLMVNATEAFLGVVPATLVAVIVAITGFWETTADSPTFRVSVAVAGSVPLSVMVDLLNFGMRALALLLTLAGFVLPAFGAKRVAVDQLEQTLAAAHSLPDAEVARQLSDLELTERLSTRKATNA